MTVYLNVRQDLTRETKDRMIKLCNKDKKNKITFGQLLNQTFAN